MNRNGNIKIPVMATFASENKYPQFLLWIGCAGAFDERYKRVIKALIRILNLVGIDFGVLGDEEGCTGDPARRAGNEMLFQIQALSNIQILKKYKVKKIITSCPHCYNTFKNEYPALGGSYEVIHHTELIEKLISEKRDQLNFSSFYGKRVTYHDSCYLGRSNNIYDPPRNIIKALKAELKEMERHRQEGLCCGAGGAQMFKEGEAGQKEINIERTEEVIRTRAEIVATACPFCMTMLDDGIKTIDTDQETQVMDVVELFEKALIKP